jgi:hypothetical protein
VWLGCAQEGNNDRAAEVSSRYQKLAVITSTEAADAAAVTAAGGTVDFVGAVPGVGTKVGATRDLDGFGVVYVNYADFEKEQPR